MQNEVSINGLKVSITKHNLKQMIESELTYSVSLSDFDLTIDDNDYPDDDIHFFLIRRRENV